jgi:hypothetical protein
MNTNLDYENAAAAIVLIKNGTAVNNAVELANAKIQLVNIMLGNEDVITEDVFVEDSVRLKRESICLSCDKNINNICMECACPLPTITNMKFKNCPLEKW